MEVLQPIPHTMPCILCLIVHVNTFLNKLVHISETFSEFYELPYQTI